MTIKEKIMMFMSKAKPPVLVNDFVNSDLNHCRSRRPVEKAFEELSKRGIIKREKCICNCSYLYKLPWYITFSFIWIIYSINFIFIISVKDVTLFIELHIEGLEKPHLIEISKASKFSQELEKAGKKFRLGKTVH